MRIVVVEDNANFRRTLADALRHDGHDVAEATDGTMLATLIPAHEADALVCDVTLPVASGLEVLEQLRKHQIDDPVVLMTGLDVDEVEALVRRFGRVRVLQKPFTLDALRSALRELRHGL